MTNGWRRRLPRDLMAGLSVALVVIPQSLAYADLAGMPPIVGLYASAAPPVVAALFASSPYLQTGPVAITALLTFGALSTLAPPGSPEYVALGLGLALSSPGSGFVPSAGGGSGSGGSSHPGAGAPASIVLCWPVRSRVI